MTSNAAQQRDEPVPISEAAAADADRLPEFTDPLPFEYIEWRPQTITKSRDSGGEIGLAAPYITARAAMEWLDRVCDPRGWIWSDRYKREALDEKHVECTITIKRPDGVSWSRADVGEMSGGGTADPIKGAYSDAFKRAAVKLGIGRALYNIGQVWVPVEQRGNSHVIPDSSYEKLRAAYDEVVAGRRRRGRRTGASRQAAPNTARQASRPSAAPQEPQQPVPTGTPGRPTDAAEPRDFTVFWGRVSGNRADSLGYTRQQVYEIAGVDSMKDWTRAQLNELYRQLKATAEGRVDGR